MRRKLLIIFLVSALVPILFFWFKGSIYGQTLDTTTILFALGRLTGLLAVVCVLLQFLMMGRTRWIETVFGLDKLTNIHRLNGYLTLTFLLAHPLLLTIAYASTGDTSIIEQFISFLTDYDDVFKAFIALSLFITVVFSSLYIVKKKLRYEHWYWVHLTTYVAILLAWGHQLELGSDFAGNNLFVYYWYTLYIFVFGNVLLFRFITPLWRFYYHRFEVDRVVTENHDVTSIYIKGTNLDKFPARAGQFIMVRFLDKSRFYESHPFSLSSMPQGKYLRITPKDSGDFTHKIRNVKKGTKVIVDGSYGIFTSKVMTRSKVLFIAGGIGITPIFSLIQELVEKSVDMTLLYSCKTEADMVFRSELNDLVKQKKLKMVCFVTEGSSLSAVLGRLDSEMIKHYVPDFKSRDIYICGPVPMLTAIREIVSSLGVPDNQIHYEKFAL